MSSDEPIRTEPQSAICSFCLKSYMEVGPVVEAETAGVYICYECSRLCSYIIEQERKHRGLPPPEYVELPDDVERWLEEHKKQSSQ